MQYLGFPTLLGTKYAEFMYFQWKYIHYALFEQKYLDSLHEYLDIYKAPCTSKFEVTQVTYISKTDTHIEMNELPPSVLTSVPYPDPIYFKVSTPEISTDPNTPSSGYYYEATFTIPNHHCTDT